MSGKSMDLFINGQRHLIRLLRSKGDCEVTGREIMKQVKSRFNKRWLFRYIRISVMINLKEGMWFSPHRSICQSFKCESSVCESSWGDSRQRILKQVLRQMLLMQIWSCLWWQWHKRGNNDVLTRKWKEPWVWEKWWWHSAWVLG